MSLHLTLIAIALWCGAPINSTKGALNFKTGVEISSEQVNQCRERLVRCSRDKKTLMFDEKALEACALAEKLQ